MRINALSRREGRGEGREKSSRGISYAPRNVLPSVWPSVGPEKEHLRAQPDATSCLLPTPRSSASKRGSKSSYNDDMCDRPQFRVFKYLLVGSREMPIRQACLHCQPRLLDIPASRLRRKGGRGADGWGLGDRTRRKCERGQGKLRGLWMGVQWVDLSERERRSHAPRLDLGTETLPQERACAEIGLRMRRAELARGAGTATRHAAGRTGDVAGPRRLPREVGGTRAAGTRDVLRKRRDCCHRAIKRK